MIRAMSEPLRGDNVLLQMFRTSQAVRELMIEAVAGTGITHDEYAVLGTIAVLRSASPTELTTHLRIPPATISRYVAGFVEAGLVERAPNRSDRRSYRLELTERGRGVVATISPRIRSLVRRLRQRADVDRIEEALEELERAARAIEVDTASNRK
jgi:DNA-binding MarR family transcriptional regulator